ncbi:MAG: thioredoxin domain-containing protein [Kofleriaceae bacterium]
MRYLALALMLGCAARTPTSGTDPISNRPGAPRPADSLEARIAMLEARVAQYAEALDFLQTVYDQQKKQAEANAASEPAPDAVFAVDITPNVKLGMVDGPATAAVTIVKAFDFACPYCEQTSTVLSELVKQYRGKLRVVFKNLVVHPDTAMEGHLASCAAAKQKKYVAFKDAFWTDAFGPYRASGGKDRASMGGENLLKIAAKIGIDSKRLKTDMASPECKAIIDGDMTELDKFKVDATPTFFINGKLISGGLSKEGFTKVIDAQLAIVTASGVPAAEFYQREVIGKGENKFRSKQEPKP